MPCSRTYQSALICSAVGSVSSPYSRRRAVRLARPLHRTRTPTPTPSLPPHPPCAAAACHMGGNNNVIPERTLRREAIEQYLDGGLTLEAIVYQARLMR